MASSSASPITSVSEPGTSDISDSLAASIITQVSPTGTTAQPARPAKSARAPKAKRKKDSAAGEGATGVAGDEDEGEQSVSGEEATDSASAEKLAAGEGEKPSTTTAVSTADPSPTPSATIVESTSPPTTTTPQPRSTPALQTKKKKRGPFASFFAACIPCLSPSDTFTDPPPSTTATKVVPTTTTGNGTASPVLSEKSPTPPLDDELLIPANPQDETDAGVVLSQEETEGVTSGAVMPPGKGRRRKSGRAPEGIITSVPEPGQRREESSEESQDESEGSEEDEEQGLIARGGVGIPIGEDGLPHPLLDPLAPELKGRKCLVLDLDETLVHSSFKQMVHQADYVVPVEIENQYHNVYVIKRPGVDNFLKAMGEIYEVVIFTASLSKYADPVLDQLDIHRVVKHRLFRESCYNNKGNYVKDLSQLGRPMSECIIIDNSPASYVFHVNNAVPISSWFNDPHDTELTDLVPFLTDLERVDDIRSVLDAGLYQHWS